jgi:hypothetical protein
LGLIGFPRKAEKLKEVVRRFSPHMGYYAIATPSNKSSDRYGISNPQGVTHGSRINASVNG